MAKAKVKKSRARRTSKLPMRVYCFGVPFISLDSDAKENGDQVFKEFLYRNVLTEIERARRDRYRVLRRSLSDRLTTLEAETGALGEKYVALKRSAGARNNPGTRDRVQTKAEFQATPVAQELRGIRELQKKLGVEIQEERKRVEKAFFEAGNAEFKRRLESRVLAYLATRDDRITNRPPLMTDEEFEDLVRQIRKKAGGHNTVLNGLRPLVLKEMEDEGEAHPAWIQKAKSEAAASLAEKKARKASDLYTGCYQHVEKAAKASFSDANGDPEYVRYDQHKGMVGVQIAGTVTVKDAFEGSDRLWIETHPDVRLRSYERASRRFASGKRKEPPPMAATMHIKLGGTKKNAVWLKLPTVLHRDMPLDGLIRWAYLKTSRIGVRPIYEVQLHVESEAHHRQHVPSGGVAVRLGWRRHEDGRVQVASLWDGSKSESIFLPAGLEQLDQHSRSLLATNDVIFDHVRGLVDAWGKDHGFGILQAAYDEWHVKRNREPKKTLQKSLPLMRNHGTLAILAFALCEKHGLPQDRVTELWNAWVASRIDRKPVGLTWKQWQKTSHKKLDLFGADMPRDEASQRLAAERFKDHYGEETFKDLSLWFENQGFTKPVELLALYLEWWRRKDKHLLDWGRSTQRRALLWRREVYRIEASRLKGLYGTVIIGEFEKSQLAEKPAPEDDTRTPQDEKANALRQFCGVSVLEGCLKHAFSKEFVVLHPIAKLPKHHYGCTTVGDGVGDLQVQCPDCSRMYEPGVNAARHLWAVVFGEQSGGALTTVTARNPSKSSVTEVLLSSP